MTNVTSGAVGEIQPTRGALRGVRGVVLAVACTVVALAGHVAGGGAAPSLPALLVVAGLVGAGFVVLADRRRGFGQILLAALGSQPLFHLAFSLAGHHPTAGSGGRPGALPAETLSTLSASRLPVTEPLLVLDVPMTAGHVVAAACVAGLVARGEAVVWVLFCLFARCCPPLFVPVSVGHPGLPADPAGPDIMRPRQFLARMHPRRGPPR